MFLALWTGGGGRGNGSVDAAGKRASEDAHAYAAVSMA